jgi:hypothetical protein
MAAQLDVGQGVHARSPLARQQSVSTHPRDVMYSRASPRPVSTDELGRCGADHGAGERCVGAVLTSRQSPRGTLRGGARRRRAITLPREPFHSAFVLTNVVPIKSDMALAGRAAAAQQLSSTKPRVAPRADPRALLKCPATRGFVVGAMAGIPGWHASGQKIEVAVSQASRGGDSGWLGSVDRERHPAGVGGQLTAEDASEHLG